MKIIRKEGVFFLSLTTMLLVAYLTLAIDLHVRHYLEKLFSEWNGAVVTIDKVRTRFLKGQIELTNIQLAHPTKAMKNILQLDSLKARFQFSPLLRKKLIFDSIEIHGISLNSPRNETDGLLYYTEYTSPSLFDREVSSLYTGIRKQLNLNPLKFIGQLPSGLLLRSTIDELRKDFSTSKTLHQLSSQFSAHVSNWQKVSKQLPTDREIHKFRTDLLTLSEKLDRPLASHSPSREELLETREQYEEGLTTIEKELASFIEGLEKINRERRNLTPHVDKDIDLVQAKLGIPPANFEDLSTVVFGHQIISILSRFNYWIDLSRELMPKGTTQGQFITIAQKRKVGTAYHYGKSAGNPTFLIHTLSLDSELDNTRNQGDVKGTITALTSDPSIYGHPLELKLSASFPNSQIKGLHIQATLDHRNDKFMDSIEAELNEFTVSDTPLTSTGDVKLKLKGARGTAKLSIKMEDLTLNSALNLTFEEAHFLVHSSYRQVEDILNEAMNNTRTLELRGTLVGPFDKLSFDAESNFGKELALGLRGEYQRQMETLIEGIRSDILGLSEEEATMFRQNILDVNKKMIPAVKDRLKTLKELLKVADKSLGRVVSLKTN